MNRGLHHLPAVICGCGHRSRFPTIPRAALLGGSPLPEERTSQGISSFHSPLSQKSSAGYGFHQPVNSIFRHLSPRAASSGQQPWEKDGESRGPAARSRDRDLGSGGRESYSATERYTSRDIDEEEDERPVEEDEADTFGALSDGNFFKESDPSLSSLSLEVDEDGRDWKRERRRRNTPHWYASRMKKLVKKGKLAEAIDFLEERMLKLDHVQPVEYNYDVLIGACGRAGYTKKAFQLYNRMKERGLHPSNFTYTSLFNACAESPWPLEDGHKRLKKLHQQLRDKDIKVNLITSHAMIKAYGKCGDIEGAFHLFHHLLSTGHVVARSFASVLIACASHKGAGFTYAIEAWRQMQARGLQPDIYCFNLLLRVVRDCSIGDQETAGKILLRPVTLDDSQLLGAGRGNKGKRRNRVKPSIGGGKENVEEMVQLPAVLIDDERTSSTETDRQMDGAVDDSGHPDGSLGYRSSKENAAGANSSIKEENWYGLETDGVERHMGTSKEYEAAKKQEHWWQDKTKDDRNSSLAVRGGKLSLDSGRQHKDPVLTLPNLLDHDANFENVESLALIQTPSDRLSLIGGVEGFLEKMKGNVIKPDVKTLSLFTDMIPAKSEDEDKLMDAAEKLGVSLDVDFYNMVIHRRSARGDAKKAKEIVSIMNQRGLRPNLRTFANLAIGCVKMNDGLQLLTDLKNLDLKPNQVVYGALMSAACRAKHYAYLVKLMNHMTGTGVKPNRRIIELLENVIAPRNSRKLKRSLQAQVNGFRGFYYKWLSATEAAPESHPWDEFTTKKGEGSDGDERHTSGVDERSGSTSL